MTRRSISIALCMLGVGLVTAGLFLLLGPWALVGAGSFCGIVGLLAIDVEAR